MRINQKNIFFVLVEPQHPGNVGAAARALNTMGFKNLVLVNPCDIEDTEAKWMAHASQEILTNAKIFPDLFEAVAERNFVVATTQRNRSFHLPYYTPQELSEKVVPFSQEHSIAIVFGREKTGLTNEELGRCDAVSTVPAHTQHPSLNLAQTVMIYCYELFQEAYGDLKKYPWRLATHKDLEALYLRLRTSLERVNFVPIDSWENFTMRFSRLMGRANPEVRDIRVWHKILKTFNDYIDSLEKKVKSH
jgi:TrmH family RNA methyltransferase